MCYAKFFTCVYAKNRWWKIKIIKDSSNLNSSKNIEDEKEYENLNFKVSNQNEHNYIY